MGIRVLGLDRVVPRKRRDLAIDWKNRVRRLRAPDVLVSASTWSDTAGLRFRGNAGWLAGSSGRTMRHDRDLSRLEIFYHDFIHECSLPQGEAWDFLSTYLDEHIGRAADSRLEWHPYAVSNRLASWLVFLAHASPPDSAGLQVRLANECLLLTDFVA